MAKARSKRTQRPTSENILGHQFIIHYVDKVDDDDSYGHCKADKKIIRIKRGLPDDIFWSTYIHECTHGVLYLSGQADAIGNEDREEGIVVAVENGLAPLIKKWMGK